MSIPERQEQKSKGLEGGAEGPCEQSHHRVCETVRARAAGSLWRGGSRKDGGWTLPGWSVCANEGVWALAQWGATEGFDPMVTQPGFMFWKVDPGCPPGTGQREESRLPEDLERPSWVLSRVFPALPTGPFSSLPVPQSRRDSPASEHLSMLFPLSVCPPLPSACGTRAQRQPERPSCGATLPTPVLGRLHCSFNCSREAWPRPQCNNPLESGVDLPSRLGSGVCLGPLRILSPQADRLSGKAGRVSWGAWL